MWSNDKELFKIAKEELFTALIGDILYKLGYFHQFLAPNIKPLRKDIVTIGRAMPVLEADVFDEVVEGTKNPIMKKPFGIMFEALDDLKEDEIYICTGSSYRYALWGGLMSTRAMHLKAAGVVEKARGEQLVKKAFQEGMSTVDAFDKFGIMQGRRKLEDEEIRKCENWFSVKAA